MTDTTPGIYGHSFYVLRLGARGFNEARAISPGDLQGFLALGIISVLSFNEARAISPGDFRCPARRNVFDFCASMRPGRFRPGISGLLCRALPRSTRFNEARAISPGDFFEITPVQGGLSIQASMRPGRFRPGMSQGAHRKAIFDVSFNEARAISPGDLPLLSSH